MHSLLQTERLRRLQSENVVRGEMLASSMASWAGIMNARMNGRMQDVGADFA